VMISLSYNTTVIPDSITNPSVDSTLAKDNTTPFSFLEFITTTKIDYTPEEYNNFYLAYLKSWSTVKNSASSKEKTNYIDLYINFLREIVIVYSTKQEQRFLSTIDFSNPLDLDIALPFFTNKIREIILFYKQKRDDTKYIVDRNKIRGTGFSIERIVYEKIVEYVFSTQETPTYLEIGTTLESIKQNLDISVEEFVDIYGNYFDIPSFLTTSEIFNSDASIDENSSIPTSDQLDKLYSKYNRNDNSNLFVRGVQFIGDDIITLPEVNERFSVEDSILTGINNTVKITPSSADLRQEIYSANFNDIDVAAFFDEVGIDEIFLTSAFLQDLPLIASVSLKGDPICDPNDPLSLFREEHICKTGLDPLQVVELRKGLIEKYAGVDFYYIDTTSVPTVSGILFKAQDPWSNIPNLQQITTPASPAGTRVDKLQIMLRNLGLFFKPDKIGLFQLDTKNYRYTIDEAVLTEQKVYIFPDPDVYGNVSTNAQDITPVIFIQDYTSEVANTSRGIAQGDPIVTNKDQSFTPYFVKSQTIQQSIENEDTFNFNFTDLYNEGYVTKLQYDIYGNEYALFKDAYGMSFKGITEKSDARLVSKLLNGHVFYDIDEGYNFDYSVYSTNGTTLRSGISTLTVDNPDQPLVTLSGFPLTLFFREFLPYQELNIPDRNIIPKFKDGGSFTFLNGTSLPDPILADDINYPSQQTYYYNTLADAGVTSLSPIERATFNTGNFTLDVKFILSSERVENYDCGFFTDEIALQNDYNYDEKYTFYDFVDEKSKTVISNLSSNNRYLTQQQKDIVSGKLFIKNQAFSSSFELSASLDPIFSKYSSIVKSDLYSNVKDYDIIYDAIVLETDNYLVVDKIDYNEGAFTAPSTKNTTFRLLSANELVKTSNRFFNEKAKTITFCIVGPEGFSPLLTEDNITQYLGNEKLIIPNIYQYNLSDHSYKKIFPMSNTNVSSLSTLFSLAETFSDDYNFNIIKINKPQLTYNSLNDVYKLTYSGVDNNNLFHLLDYTFFISPDDEVVFTTSNTYQHKKIIRTTDFYTQSTFANINVISEEYPIQKLANNSIDLRISDVTDVEDSKKIFSSFNNLSSIYIRNPNSWVSDIDLTGLPVFQSQTNNNRFCGALITRRHVINAAHANPAPGSIIRFVDSDNNVITRTIVARRSAPTPAVNDINISLLDEDLPSSIKSYKIMPVEFLSFLPPRGSDLFNIISRTALFTTNQQLKALVKEHVDVINTPDSNFLVYPPLDPTRLLFHETAISGDSGSAVGFIMRDELVLGTTFWTSTIGPRHGFYIDDIQQTVDILNTNNGVSGVYPCELYDLNALLLTLPPIIDDGKLII